MLKVSKISCKDGCWLYTPSGIRLPHLYKILKIVFKYDFKGGAAHENGMMQRGDILIAVDENPVTGLSHSDVILFMSNAARNGVVKLTLRRENDITRTNSNSTCKL